MARFAQPARTLGTWPAWVPDATRLYLDHIECGLTLRALARRRGCHASTILRQVRKTESRRDDPLVDSLLDTLGAVRRGQGLATDTFNKVPPAMTQKMIDDRALRRDATRILSALMKPGALLAVMPDVTTAVVLQDNVDGVPRPIATVEREVAEVMALKEWIRCTPKGRVSRYFITPAGRVALNRFLAEAETARAGFAEAQAAFDYRTRKSGEGIFSREPGDEIRPRGTKRRVAGAETPLQVLARRRDKDGLPYLTPELVCAGERLRTDFELAQIGANPGGMSWEGLMTDGAGRARQNPPGGGAAERQLAAKERFVHALRALGPELGEVALITCCHQRGMEAAESELGMPARAGKFVLKIALNLLERHYRKSGREDFDLIY
jgi:hypothetical protein